MNKKIFLLLTLSINLSYKIHAQEKNSPKYFYTKTEKEQIYKQSRQAALQEVKDLAEAIIIIPPVLGVLANSITAWSGPIYGGLLGSITANALKKDAGKIFKYSRSGFLLGSIVYPVYLAKNCFGIIYNNKSWLILENLIRSKSHFNLDPLN